MFLPFPNSNYVVSTQRVSKIILSNEPDDEMALSEHIEEFSQRLIFCFGVLALITIACFTDIKEIVRIFQAPAIGIKFLQFAPGEYFFCIYKNRRLLWHFIQQSNYFIPNIFIRCSGYDKN